MVEKWERPPAKPVPSLKKLWQKRSRGAINEYQLAEDIKWQIVGLCQNLTHTAERDNFVNENEGEFIHTDICRIQLQLFIVLLVNFNEKSRLSPSVQRWMVSAKKF